MESDTRIVYVCPDAADGTVRKLRERVGPVTTVGTVADCLEALSSADCVVMTDGLSDADPVECCRRIRERRPDVPLVVFPADGSESLAGDVIAAGADGYIPRADGVETLTTRLEALLYDEETASTPAASPATHGPRSALTDPFKSFIERSPLAIIEWSPDFDVVSWNPAAAELFGYTASEARGESGTDLIVPNDIRDELLEHWDQLLDGEFDGNTAWRTNENVRKDGTTITCEWVNMRLTGENADRDGSHGETPPDDEVAGVISLVQDVTAERKRADALEALQETTRELMRAESAEEIAAIVTDATEHVIDSPLAVLRFYDEETETLELAAISERLDDVTGDLSSIGRADRLLWQPFEDGEPFVVEDVPTERIPYDLEIDVNESILYPMSDHGMLSVASAANEDLDLAEIHLVHVLAATAEAALDRAARERELEQTKTIVETVGDCVYQLDTEGRFVALNETMAWTTGYDREELLGEHVSTVVTDESVERGFCHADALANEDGRNVATYEVTLVDRDGERSPAEVNTALLRSDGEVEGLVGIARDIGDRRRIERELVEQKAKIESLHEIASRLDDCESQQQVFEETVEAAERVLNYDICVADQIDGDHLEKVALSSHIDDADYVERIHVEEGIAGKTYRNRQSYRIGNVAEAEDAAGTADTYQSLLSAPIGSHGVFQAVSTERDAFDESDEELVELLLSHAADTLDRLAFEAELKEERDRFGALFENVPDGVVSVRQCGSEPMVDEVNPAFERIFGYEEQEVLDEPLDRFIVPADRTDGADRLNVLGCQGETAEAEVKRRTADGLRDFMLRVVPVEMDERSNGAFGLYTDITDQKQRQQRVEILNRVLRHDLRNGMNIIDGCAEMLAEAVENDDLEYVKTIQERADDLVSLAEKTRAVERTLERSESTAGPIDVAETVEQAVARLESIYTDVDVRCTLPDQIFARADEYLQTAIFHVLENAVEHNDSSTPTLEVTVNDCQDDMVSVSVLDDGPGMPDEERELLQEDREITQLRHASGLGLWLVNWVVTQSGGQLTFGSNEPRGTVVTLELPRADAELVRTTGDGTVTGD